ncbi:hypothetical protein EYB48_18925 [Undibacterium sp. B2R-29]|nr:hypothetical protein [Undibacterium crateris]
MMNSSLNTDVIFQLEAWLSETDWFQFEIKDNKFIGSGGIGNLKEVLHSFLSYTANGDVI